VHVSEMKPGGAAFRHTHETSEQIYIVLSGKAEMVVGGQAFKVARGDAVYIPANIEHEAKVIGKETFKTIVVFSPPL
jgi:quercetin dioxygenase-like cupin family protein